jgi:hypothetical protein
MRFKQRIGIGAIGNNGAGGPDNKHYPISIASLEIEFCTKKRSKFGLFHEGDSRGFKLLPFRRKRQSPQFVAELSDLSERVTLSSG